MIFPSVAIAHILSCQHDDMIKSYDCMRIVRQWRNLSHPSFPKKTMDAMSEAIDNAAVVCYGVSAACEQKILQCSAHEMHLVTPRTLNHILSVVCTDKESANCRLECQYAHQTGVDMIPMMCVIGLGCHISVDALKL
eukprot:SAG31_NODE_646_length_13223_cov_14.088845_7_plen_137_part_00